MADRLASPDDDIKEADQEKETPKTVTAKDTAPSDGVPKNYINPFDDESNMAPDGYPYVFSDIDFELKRNPRLFAGFDTMVVDMHTQSKSEIGRVWLYKRWKTWQHLVTQNKREISLELDDNDKEGTRVTAQVNGVTYFVVKGVYGENMLAPFDIYKLFMDSRSQTLAIGQESLLASLSHKLDPVTGLPKDRERLER
jgi:hypothetical protein